MDIAYAAQENLERDSEVTVWTQGVFDLSRFTLESLLDALDDIDFAIFIFAPDDVTKMRDQKHIVVRDNIVFELGLFIGHLGRERNFMFIPRDTELHIPTDLLGITPATYEPNRQDENLVASLGPACNRVRKALRKFGPLAPNASPQPEVSASDDFGEFDENDIVSILESWMGARQSLDNQKLLRFADIDREVGLPAGSARVHLSTAAKKYRYVPYRQGKATIIFKKK